MNKWIGISLLALTPGLALAQGSDGFNTLDPRLVDVQRGTHDLTFSGAGAADSDFSNNTLGLAIGYGWYSNQNLEFSVRQNVNLASVGGDNLWTGSTRVALDYHWTGGSWRPFAGALLGYIYGDGVNDTGIIGPEIGIKYYVERDTFLYWLEEYQVLFESGSDQDSFENGSFAHSLGIGFSF